MQKPLRAASQPRELLPAVRDGLEELELVLCPGQAEGDEVLFVCGSDTRCAVLQFRILLDQKGNRANESHKGHPRLHEQLARVSTCY